MSLYAKSRNGLIHLINVVNPEYTLCGDAFDIDAVDVADAPHAWDQCDPAPVTCPDCTRVIKSCREAKLKREVRE